jgi:hypothetical protein
MIRITTWRQVGNAPPDAAPGAVITAFNEAAAVLRKVPGTSDVHWGFGQGGIVTVAVLANYAAADAVLKDAASQGAIANVFALGFGIAEDNFVLDLQQVTAFIPQQ